MSAKCPSCSAEITSLSGFVPQAEHVARLKEKTDAVTNLERTVGEMKPRAEGYDAATKALNEARGDLTIFQTLASRGYTDPRVAASVKALHSVEMGSVEEARRVDLGAWLDGDGKTHPLLAGFQPTAQPANPANPNPANPANPGNPAVNPANPNPPANRGALPNPTPGQTFTTEQVAAMDDATLKANLPLIEKAWGMR